MSSKDSHQKYLDHLRELLWNIPDSEELLPLLKLRVTAEDAEILSKMPSAANTPRQLARKLKIPIEELTPILQQLARKGVIYHINENGKDKYSLIDFFSMAFRYTGWVESRNEGDWYKKIAPLLNRYYIEKFANEINSYPTQLMRAVPVNKTVEDERQIAPYEHIIEHVKQYDNFAVSNCSCRLRHRTDPEFEKTSCKEEVETCLHWGDLGKYIVENNMGRGLTKDEALNLLEKCADAGLVHAFYNNLTDNDTVCNCCSDCCLYLEPIVKMPGLVPRGHNPSRYIRVWADEENCIQCGLCAKRCPIDAIQFNKESKEISFTPERCLGCGVCVHKCPTNAIIMVRREKDMEPDIPKDLTDWAMRMMKEREKSKNIAS